MKMTKWITRQFRRLHNDECGESSALSNVMLLAVAALAGCLPDRLWQQGHPVPQRLVHGRRRRDGLTP